MKITFMLANLGIKGGHRVIYEYANRLQERGHEVSIVYPIIPVRTDLLRYFGFKKSVFKTFKSQNLVKELSWEINAKLIRVPTLSAKLRWMWERKIPDGDAIIATDFSTAYLVPKLGKEKGEKYYFVQGYEIWEAWENERCWEGVREIEENPKKFCIAMADVDTKDLPFHKTKKLVDNAFKLPLRKITISTWLKELLEKKFGQKVEGVIINGVNFETFYNENKTWNDKKRILAPYQTPRSKGVEDAIKAFEIVREKFPEVSLVMFGLFKEKIPDWIEFHENISDEELRKLYNSSDIFLFPSRIEGFGLPPMEAMACKCAVAATNVGAISDYAIPGETVLTSPPGQPELLAENISYLLEDEDRIKRISEAGYSYIKQFTWEKAVDDFERVLGG